MLVFSTNISEMEPQTIRWHCQLHLHHFFEGCEDIASKVSFPDSLLILSVPYHLYICCFDHAYIYGLNHDQQWHAIGEHESQNYGPLSMVIYAIHNLQSKKLMAKLIFSGAM